MIFLCSPKSSKLLVGTYSAFSVIRASWTNLEGWMNCLAAAAPPLGRPPAEGRPRTAAPRSWRWGIRPEEGPKELWPAELRPRGASEPRRESERE